MVIEEAQEGLTPHRPACARTSTLAARRPAS
jgi:hypothetical protein